LSVFMFYDFETTIIRIFEGLTRHGKLSVFMFYDFETTIIRIFEII